MKKFIKPSDLPIISEIVQFLYKDLGVEFIAIRNYNGWQFITNKLEIILLPQHAAFLKQIKDTFPEQKIFFTCLGDKGFEGLKRNEFYQEKILCIRVTQLK